MMEISLIKTSTRAFSENERVALLSLIKARPVVVSKRQAPNIQQEKKAAWEEIRLQYAEMFPGTERSTESLKRWWDNYKQKAKREQAATKLHRCMTGGGPPLPKKEDPVTLAAAPLLEAELAMADDIMDTLDPQSISAPEPTLHPAPVQQVLLPQLQQHPHTSSSQQHPITVVGTTEQVQEHQQQLPNTSSSRQPIASVVPATRQLYQMQQLPHTSSSRQPPIPAVSTPSKVPNMSTMRHKFLADHEATQKEKLEWHAARMEFLREEQAAKRKQWELSIKEQQLAIEERQLKLELLRRKLQWEDEIRQEEMKYFLLKNSTLQKGANE